MAGPLVVLQSVTFRYFESEHGITDVSFVAQHRELAVVDATLSGMNAEKRESAL